MKFKGEKIGSVFSSPLKKTKYSERIYNLKNNGNFLIREQSLASLESEYRNKINGSTEAFDLIQKANTLFLELKTKYHISTSINFIVANNENGEKVSYSVVERINGENLINYENKDKIKEEVQNLYIKLSKYYLDKLRNKEPFLTDLNNPTQYIFGKKSKSLKDEIHMIDSDIFLDDRTESLPIVVYWFTRHFKWVQKKYGINNEEIKDNLKLFIQEYKNRNEISDRNKKILLEIEKFLEDKKFGEEITPAIPTFGSGRNEGKI